MFPVYLGLQCKLSIPWDFTFSFEEHLVLVANSLICSGNNSVPNNKVKFNIIVFKRCYIGHIVWCSNTKYPKLFNKWWKLQIFQPSCWIAVRLYYLLKTEVSRIFVYIKIYFKALTCEAAALTGDQHRSIRQSQGVITEITNFII